MPMPMMGPQAQSQERPPFVHPSGGASILVHQLPSHTPGIQFQHMPGVGNIPQLQMHDHFARPG